MAGNNRGSERVRVRKTEGAALFDRIPDRTPFTCAQVPPTYTQNVLFRFEPYVNLLVEGCPEE
ncbi:hypothetical protein GCM10017674_10160 [Streptomyces gardneri]|uniref:Uncharacterized protein n=1 Tax=Streptomyces gardneri TaxID=66892 RepID=A0A4Y3RRF5_9ACTN|nr:hypothetical protein SGA01_54890 [Streptomyces gardneri]GHG85883.1 hypothetical protein GCM10017674_10160 [Streptomyces gardneri]